MNSAETLAETHAAIDELPPLQRDVMVLRDVEGRSPAEVSAALELDPHTERDLLNQARGHVRAHLERHFDEGEA